MPKKVVFIHTVPSLIPVFNELCKELIPAGTEILHIADEMLARIAIANGGLTPFLYQRTADHVIAARQAGADVVQATCSSISPCVQASRSFVDIPVLKIDEPMVLKAIQYGNRIGVVATAVTTLGPTTDLIQKIARESGKMVKITAVLCEGAYSALLGGNLDLHDRIVLKYLRELITRVDVILLAQASMARVADQLTAQEQVIPILTSPRLAVVHLAEVLVGLPDRI